MNDLTLKARLADADPTSIEKYGAKGVGLMGRVMPRSFSNRRFGEAGVNTAEARYNQAADSRLRNRQEQNRANLQQRQAAGSGQVANFNPQATTVGRENKKQMSDRVNLENQQNALRVANQTSGATAEITPIQPMGQQSPGANQSTEVPDSLNTEQKLDANGKVIESTQTVSNEEPKPEESGAVPQVPPVGDTQTAPPPAPPTSNVTDATPQQAGGADIGQVDAQVGTNNNRNQASVGPMSFNFGNMGGGGQAQPQQQQQQQMTPQQQAKAAQVANATRRANTRGGLATNPLLGVATMGLSNVAGMAYNAYQRNQGNKQLQQLSKMLLMRKSIGMRNTTGALRRGRI